MSSISRHEEVLWIEVDGFYACRHEDGGRALVVTRYRAILDANGVARERGVRPGMGIRQAKSILLQCVSIPWEGDLYEEASREWMDECTAYSGVIEPIDQHCVALDLSRHPDPLDIADSLIRSLAQRTRLPIRFGWSNSKWIARLSAEKGVLARTDPAGFLAGLPVGDLLPIPIEVRQRLEFLGYRSIGEVAVLPLSVLQGQFGALAMTIRNAALGRMKDPVVAGYPRDSVHDCLYPNGPLECLEEVDLCLQSLAENLGRRLILRGLQGSSLSVSLDLEPEGVWEASRRFTKPLTNPLSILIGLRLMLEGKLKQPVIGLRVALSELVVRRQHQPRFKGLEAARPPVEPALRHVKTVYGDRAVVRACDIPVPRHVRVLREWQRATGWI